MIPDQEGGPAQVYLNGRLVPAGEATISIFDHGLLYGDGLFETLRVANGRCFRPEAHLDRLEAAAGRLELSLPAPRQLLLEALQATVHANGLREGAVRLTVTRGSGAPVPDPRFCPQPSYFITARDLHPVSAEAFARGVWLGLGPQHPRLFVPGLKSLCFLPYQLARTAARTAGCDDAVLTWGDQVVETGISNLFQVHGGVLSTPHLESGCLPGTTRGLVLELAARLGIPAQERAVAVAELDSAAELMVTNSVMGVMPVRKVGNQPLPAPPGPVTRALSEALATLIRQETG